MVAVCVICGVKYGTPNVSFHRFPKDPTKCNTWVRLSNCKELLNKPAGKLNRSTRICSRHFQPNQYNGKRLMYGVNPSLNLKKR